VVYSRTLSKNHRELLFALESARNRLAVAIAAETKSTPPERWQYYFEISERTRRFIKKLRNVNPEMPQLRQGWSEAVESLKHIPSQREAAQICKLLGDVMAELE
jgi:hypothetical protein